MGFKKEGISVSSISPLSSEGAKAVPAEDSAGKAESGTQAAIDRLVGSSGPAPIPNKAYKPRDYDAEARGKTRCALYEAALMSPAIAGMKWKTPEELMAILRKFAEDGTRFTFGD